MSHAALSTNRPFPSLLRTVLFSPWMMSALALPAALSALPTPVMAEQTADQQASAQQTAAASTPAGTLTLHSRKGDTQSTAVRLGTDMKVSVAGPLARITVTQAFLNTGRDWMEAKYLFPLPEDGAVDSLKMVVGDRIVIGEIQPREKARQTYQEAMDRGESAGLLEQQRPNMFTTKVANVGPGETVLISIAFQVPVIQKGDTYSLRLPLVVGPRYIPNSAVISQGPNGPQIDPDKLANAAALIAPVQTPSSFHLASGGEGASSDTSSPLSISVDLDPGFKIANLHSDTHEIDISGDSADHRAVHLKGHEGQGNRDFELVWQSQQQQTSTALFQQTWKGDHYMMAVVTPPAATHTPAPQPREMIFVIDNSGSMGGTSMQQAKASLVLALQSLKPGDRFNVIRFDDSLTTLFNQPVDVTPETVSRAIDYTNSLSADGGTEMLPALRAALHDATPDDTSHVRQVIFLTDGDIGNEDAMLSTVGRDHGRSRVFMVGIGSAPNSFLMSRMAEVGRGTFTHISDIDQVKDRMSTLLGRLTHPVVTDLHLHTSGSTIAFTPSLLPDLYQGEPLVVYGRTHSLHGTITITGKIGTTPWTQTLDLDQARDAKGVARQWAKRKVTDTEVAARLGTITDDAAATDIASLGETYGLVTRETSLVAVDHTPRRPAGARLTREELPLPLPEGWDFDTLFGGAHPDAPRPADVASADGQNIPLPQTATNAPLLILSGLFLALGGLLLRLMTALWGRRQDATSSRTLGDA